MKGLRTGLVLLSVAVGVLVSARLILRAQEREVIDRGGRESLRGTVRPDRVEAQKAEPDPAAPTVQDALQRTFAFPFAEPTSLKDVCQYLRQALKAPVVLDLAALDRQELEPDDPVRLELEGVRLKTGLKLLLDQVGLTYQVVPEDNLLILTDTQGSTEPIDQILSELKALHRDMHELQTAVDDVKWSLGLDEDEPGAMMHKPTIIEEVPGEDKPLEKPEELPPAKANRSRSRPGA
jgi:hypothetical protein